MFGGIGDTQMRILRTSSLLSPSGTLHLELALSLGWAGDHLRKPFPSDLTIADHTVVPSGGSVRLSCLGCLFCFPFPPDYRRGEV